MVDQTFREFDVSAGGFALRGWPDETGVGRQAVLVCPELGSAELLPVDSSARMLSWCPPGNPANTLSDHVDDALGVLEAAGVKECTVVGWSAGTVVAVELARRFSDRVRGLLLLAGPPTAAADALLGALGVPEIVRRLLAASGSASLRLTGGLLESITSRLPITDLATQLWRYSGLMSPDADRSAAAAALRQLLPHDWRWHAELSLAWSAAARTRVVELSCPLTVLAGQHDVLADFGSVARAVAALPQARVRMLPTSHFIPFEAPEVVRDELALLLRRVEAVECARLGIDPPPPTVRRIRVRTPEPGLRRRTEHPRP
ncbi:alpha/beta hydrolase [Saccharopolyspora sp. K220]|uniref:alpha/beta fold hydrolase n=1 Tax=Saccharopolyspora soli TaxID=2926618 RepID=UPI001F59307C|nr:alpha/beta hydrolase [Saccharopolyspora soli]MCI2423327.1 alpha/beta hydrolase [Saccharopolyspora soli]